MQYIRLYFVLFVLFTTFSTLLAQERVQPLPTIRIPDLQATESPITVTSAQAVVEENAFFQRIRTTFSFTNPNVRQMAGEFEFPLTAGAIVCGYALEINGEMVPGVICEKEKARVAFENETRKGVDPGLVEHVKGNIWRTRIFPLLPQTPRSAAVEVILPKALTDVSPQTLLERDGDDYFIASTEKCITSHLPATLAAFSQGFILWDASLSAESAAATWRERLAMLPEKGSWQVCFFRNTPGTIRTFTDRTALLQAVEALVYDGGTDIGAAVQCIPSATQTLLFTDEMDTLGLNTPDYEARPGLIVASRESIPERTVCVEKLTREQAEATGLPCRDSTLLATVWAAHRMADLATQADTRKAEFLALGRKYTIAGPNHALIVLETLEQWLEHDLEPPQTLSFHAEWVKRRAAQDDPIAAKKRQAEYEKQLLHYWEERVTWWNDPKPPKKTPSSGLFGSLLGNRHNSTPYEAEEAATYDAAPAPVGQPEITVGARNAAPQVNVKRKRITATGPQRSPAPTVTLKPWNPDTPYLKALEAAQENDAYAVYLKERKTYADAPAFYLDCADWFFKHTENTELAERIISNLAEFKLDDAALWRTMGWRLREAKRYALAIHCFRKVLALRGEEGQSYSDLALILAEAGKDAVAQHHFESAKPLLEEALTLFTKAIFAPHARRSGRQGNDLQSAVIALEELNGLISWIEAQAWPQQQAPTIPAFDAAYRRDLPLDLRIVMRWDADQTDIDLHVLEPDGEEAYYGHRRTSTGGFVSEDVTTGYGPEEYLRKEALPGTYQLLTNYFASRQTALTGATTVSVTVYTHWATAAETQQILTLRLDKPKERYHIGNAHFQPVTP